jgi:heme-degrading monooxygenase HmoA
MANMFTPDRPIITSVLLCQVARHEQQHVTERLEYLVGANMNGLDGFLSAKLEKSIRGDAVAVFSIWQSQQHHASMLKDSAVRECLHDISMICNAVETHLYVTVKSFEGIARNRLKNDSLAQERPARIQ